jgi:hypothetical protein
MDKEFTGGKPVKGKVFDIHGTPLFFELVNDRLSHDEAKNLAKNQRRYETRTSGYRRENRHLYRIAETDNGWGIFQLYRNETR